MRPTLGETLRRLVAEVDADARRAADPVAFVHRYDRPADQEIAGVLAASLAYGRVAAFRPVLQALFARADAAGGPRAWVEAFDPATDGPGLADLSYRWNRGVDWVLLLGALRGLVEAHGTLERALPAEGGLPEALDAFVVALRAEALRVAPAAGLAAEDFEALPRGFRTMVPRPADGSATKRWWMFLRWMIRPADGVDLGAWTSRRPAELLIPLDTHVHRIARFVGLTARPDASLRTAREVTARLAALDPDDPVRFDFALAHLGISGACRGHRDPEICPGCPLDPVCAAGPG